MQYYKAKQCFLEVRVTNDAGISLYKKLGFEVTRTINGYYTDGEDAYVMSKKTLDYLFIFGLNFNFVWMGHLHSLQRFWQLKINGKN